MLCSEDLGLDASFVAEFAGRCYKIICAVCEFA